MIELNGGFSTASICSAAREALSRSDIFKTYFWILVAYVIIDVLTVVVLTEVFVDIPARLSINLSGEVQAFPIFLGVQVFIGWQIGLWVSSNVRVLAGETLKFRDGFRVADCRTQHVLLCSVVVLALFTVAWFFTFVLTAFGVTFSQPFSEVVSILAFLVILIVSSFFSLGLFVSGYFQEALFFPDQGFISSLRSVASLTRGHYWTLFRLSMKIPEFDRKLDLLSRFQMSVAVAFLSPTIAYVGLHKKRAIDAAFLENSNVSGAAKPNEFERPLVGGEAEKTGSK